MSQISVLKADLNEGSQSDSIIFLLNSYAQDPAGGGKELSDFCKQNLISELRQLASCHVFIAFIGDDVAGLAICFEGFSTFACKRLLNIHDFVVLTRYRGRGASQVLLDEVEKFAKSMNFCKITLEVLDQNIPAMSAYKRFGFQEYSLDPAFGRAVFMHKLL